jgi:hypothetical protein
VFSPGDIIGFWSDLATNYKYHLCIHQDACFAPAAGREVEDTQRTSHGESPVAGNLHRVTAIEAAAQSSSVPSLVLHHGSIRHAHDVRDKHLIEQGGQNIGFMYQDKIVQWGGVGDNERHISKAETPKIIPVLLQVFECICHVNIVGLKEGIQRLSSCESEKATQFPQPKMSLPKLFHGECLKDAARQVRGPKTSRDIIGNVNRHVHLATILYCILAVKTWSAAVAPLGARLWDFYTPMVAGIARNDGRLPPC